MSVNEVTPVEMIAASTYSYEVLIIGDGSTDVTSDPLDYATGLPR